MTHCFPLFLFLILSPLAKVTATESDTSRVFQLIETANEKRKQGHVDAAEHDLKQAGALARQLSFDNGLLQYAGHYCVFLYHQLRYTEALAMAGLQLAMSLKLNNSQKAANAHNNIALQHQAMGNLHDAAQSLMKALDISAALENPSESDLAIRRKFLNNLSSLLLDMNDTEKGLHYAMESYELATALGDSIDMGRSLVNIMVAEAMANKLGDAVKHGKQLLAIGQSKGDIQMELRAYINLSDIYRRQKRHQLALETYQKAQRLLKDAPPGNEVYVFSGISSVYKDMGQYRPADNYFDKAIGAAEEELAKPQLIELLLSGAEIKEGIGAYQAALVLRKRHQQLRDSMLNHTTHRTLQELEMKYQTAQKEKALAERDLLISEQRAELDRKNKWMILSVALAILLTTTLLSGRLINRQKRKVEASLHENRLLEAQLNGEETERARTARELHDGVASMLAAAKLEINNMDIGNTAITGPIGQLIDHAAQEIRNISHNLAPEIVLMEGFEYAIRAFCRRIQQPGLQLECYVLGALPKLEKTTELLLYRTIQEAVTNMVKHAGATEGMVQVAGEDNHLYITIEDNGKGFAPEKLQTGGIGLKNLSARIKLLKGTLDIRSAPGKGTSIYIEIESGLSPIEATAQIPA